MREKSNKNIYDFKLSKLTFFNIQHFQIKMFKFLAITILHCLLKFIKFYIVTSSLKFNILINR